MQIAVVIPCYRVKAQILGVLAALGPEVWRIYVVDDACPEQTGDLVETHCSDLRITVLRHPDNQGVGGAVMTGYAQAITDGADLIVKIDGDGQMDPHLLMLFAAPIIAGQADYTKGNRFYDLANLGPMPGIRLFGNAALSMLAKLSTGYWDIFDPTNGYTAIHAAVARRLPFDKLSRRYFFETDILFRLNTVRAVIADIPMDAVYGEEVSNLKISSVLGEFWFKHWRNFTKRVFYNYFLRDLTIASLELVCGLALLVFGIGYGSYHWLHSIATGIPTTAGTVMLSALPVLSGLQLVLAFINYDIANVPRRPLHPALLGLQRAARLVAQDHHADRGAQAGKTDRNVDTSRRKPA